jgi:hypothetical protein
MEVNLSGMNTVSFSWFIKHSMPLGMPSSHQPLSSSTHQLTQISGKISPPHFLPMTPLGHACTGWVEYILSLQPCGRRSSTYSAPHTCTTICLLQLASPIWLAFSLVIRFPTLDESHHSGFLTHNFPLTHDCAELLGINVVNMAVEMGHLLVQMHMKAKNDVQDIEIVLGTNVTNNSTWYCELWIWVIYFNQVAPFDCPKGQIPHLIEAFFTNEAYFPCPHPSDKLYQLFLQAYIAECGKIENVVVVIGRMFIGALEREQLARDKAVHKSRSCQVICMSHP